MLVWGLSAARHGPHDQTFERTAADLTAGCSKEGPAIPVTVMAFEALGVGEASKTTVTRMAASRSSMPVIVGTFEALGGRGIPWWGGAGELRTESISTHLSLSLSLFGVYCNACSQYGAGLGMVEAGDTTSALEERDGSFQTCASNYSHSEVDRIWVMYRESIMFHSKVTFYLLKYGCRSVSSSLYSSVYNL